MTTIKDILSKVDAVFLEDKWYEICEEIGKYIVSFPNAREKLKKLNKPAITAICGDFIFGKASEIEEKLGVPAIEGLNEYVTETITDPDTGEIDQNKQFTVSVNLNICSDAIGKELYGDEFEEWSNKSYEESRQADGRIGELGAKRMTDTWTDKI